jgi:hypothetical protein
MSFEICDMHATDLYLTLFSYLRNNEIPCIHLYTAAISESKIKYFYHSYAYNINRMTYREFEQWWDNRFWYDSQLLNSKEIYAIKLTFLPEAVNFFIKKNNISLEDFYLSYKPAYPWSSSIIQIFDSFIDASNEDIFWNKSPHVYTNKRKPNKY